MVFVFLWPALLSLRISRSIHVAALDMISFFFMAEEYSSVCVYTCRRVCGVARLCLPLYDSMDHQDLLFMGFSRQEYWSGLPLPSPGIFPTQGLNLCSCIGRRVLYHWAPREAQIRTYVHMYIYTHTHAYYAFFFLTFISIFIFGYAGSLLLCTGFLLLLWAGATF